MLKTVSRDRVNAIRGSTVVNSALNRVNDSFSRSAASASATVGAAMAAHTAMA